MNIDIDGKDALTCRRALEGLRNGVPNEKAVEMLGCNQSQAENEFKELLSKAIDSDNPSPSSLGMLVSGDFGTGKSHLLSYLEHHALSQGFVCSKVTISKETPLYKMDRVFKSAIDHGRMPDRTGQLMEELGLKLESSPEAYSRFFRWANSEQNGLHTIFPATLMVHERANDFELVSKIRAFWSGEKIRVPDVKGGLRQIDQLPNYSFRAPKVRELPPQHLRFATELVKGAGYKGWVILLDEIELVGSYSVLQRAKSYAELARLWGKIENEEYPGLVVVGTVTSDFASAILSDNEHSKKDRRYAAQRLRSRGDDTAAARAETGMRTLERDVIQLEPPTDEDVNATVETLRQIHGTAYGWDAPQLEAKAGGAGYQGRMRYKVRAAINEWDLLRLYPNARPETEGTEFTPQYEETPELEQETQDEGDEGGDEQQNDLLSSHLVGRVSGA